MLSRPGQNHSNLRAAALYQLSHKKALRMQGVGLWWLAALAGGALVRGGGVWRGARRGPRTPLHYVQVTHPKLSSAF